MNSETLSSAPNVSAFAAATPCFWKNRTSSATRAAVLGIARLMNEIDISSATVGPYASGWSHAPSTEIASANRGS